MSASSPDLDAITADVEMAKRSPEMARHVALDHTPELINEVACLRTELSFARDGYDLRPMTDLESRLFTEVLSLRQELGKYKRGELP